MNTWLFYIINFIFYRLLFLNNTIKTITNFLNSNFISSVTGSLIGGVVAFKIAKFEIERHERTKEKEKMQEITGIIVQLEKSIKELKDLSFRVEFFAARSRGHVSSADVESQFNAIKNVFNSIHTYKNRLVFYLIEVKDEQKLEEEWDKGYKNYNELRRKCETSDSSFNFNDMEDICNLKDLLNEHLGNYSDKLKNYK